MRRLDCIHIVRSFSRIDTYTAYSVSTSYGILLRTLYSQLPTSQNDYTNWPAAMLRFHSPEKSQANKSHAVNTSKHGKAIAGMYKSGQDLRVPEG
jgi:hypothetical protein